MILRMCQVRVGKRTAEETVQNMMDLSEDMLG